KSGLGCIAEEEAMAGHFAIPGERRLGDEHQERLLRLATIEELLRHGIALRGHSSIGSQLIFPSLFTRERPGFHRPQAGQMVWMFEGPVLYIYYTLVINLSHSMIFKIKNLEHIWRDCVVYEAVSGGECGVAVRQIDEGHGELMLFFDDAHDETQRFF